MADPDRALPLTEREIETGLAETVPMDAVEPGARVEVRNRLDGRWTKGFEIVSSGPGGHRLRRLSDGDELPVDFCDDDVRRERDKRDHNSWWY